VKKVILIAAQELRLNFRNKWILAISILFGVLTLTVAYSGMVTAGYVGFQDFRRTGASIVNLVLYLVPIIALMMGVYSFTSSRGYLDLMVAQPVARWKIIIGKFSGSLASLILATSAGFSMAGIIISFQAGSAGSWRFLLVVMLSILLGAVFLSLAYLLVLMLKRRNSAIGLSLVVWFLFVIFYDLMMLASTVYLSHGTLKASLLLGLIFNPVDLIRVTSLIIVGSESMFGAAGVIAVKTFGSMGALVTLSFAVIIIWLIAPLALSLRIFKRQEI
jgi:Cu-processing system permease protein